MQKMNTRRKKYEYFERMDGAPLPITATVEHQLQFHEMDPANIAWHGQYPAFFEKAQAAIGKKCGLTYSILRKAGLLAPVRQFHAEYLQVLDFDEIFTVTGSMIWSDGPRINTEYVIRKADSSVAGWGYTVQLFMDAESHEAYLLDPDFLIDLRKKWRNGEFHS